ncbi:MAG: glycoside hydrolase family 172 protein [Chthonomonadales bacterium]
MKRNLIIFATFLLAMSIAGPVLAQKDNPSISLGSPLAGLANAKSGVTKHEGSWDRGGGNGDARGVAPGETLTLLDYNGAGIIRRFWVTIAPRSDMQIHRQAIIRMYWDGETNPSVEAPIGDFFGVGFGEQKDFISTPLNETSGGYNCYWPMPFHKSAKWTITNMSSKRIDAFYYNIDFVGYDKLDKDMRHFHAQFNRENPTEKGKNYTILDAEGDGHFVGTLLNMQNRRGHGFGFLEGDEMFYFDGETKPSVNGTGTEDYFSSGWYFDRGPYSAPYHGVTILDAKMGRVSAYRWHIEDAMPFHKSLKATIEHGNENDHEADYSSVAFWYQSEPHKPFPAFTKDASTLLPFVPPLPFKVAGAIEAESLKATAIATSGNIDTQGMEVFTGNWSGDMQLWWLPQEAGAELTLQLPAQSDGEFELTGYFTRAKDYAKIKVMQGDTQIGAEINLYDPEVVPTKAIVLGKVKLVKGANPIRIVITGKDDKSQGYLVGVDAFTLKK